MKLFNGKYIIECDNLNATLRERTNCTKLNKKTGIEEVVYERLAYCNRLDGALIYLFNYMIKKECDGISDVEEIINTIKQCNVELLQEIKEINI